MERTLWTWTGFAVFAEIALIVWAVLSYDASDFFTTVAFIPAGTFLLIVIWGVGVGVAFVTKGLVDWRRERRARSSSS